MGKLSNSLWGISPDDVGLFPSEERHVLPVSLWCDDKSHEAVMAVYERIAQKSTSYLHRLNSAPETWLELLPLIVGPAWGVISQTITRREAVLIPCVQNRFFYDPALGMLTMDGLGMLFLRTSVSRTVQSVLNTPISSPMEVGAIRRELGRAGWATENISGRKVDVNLQALGL